jgi:nitrite transporter NirC
MKAPAPSPAIGAPRRRSLYPSKEKETAMFSKTLDSFAQLAAEKAAFCRDSPLAFVISSMMAGAYVGIGIILIFTLGQQIEPSLRSLVMGGCFGIALTLVVFAGSDLFTGHTMFMTIGMARRTVDLAALARAWILCWIGNLLGSALLAVVFWLAGGGQILKEGADLIFAASAAKMNAPVVALIARGALCNWLVCLALWTSARATSDAAKCILIWWCLFAFIAAGFEHSIANMTVFSIALLGNHPTSVSVAGMFYNLLWVTIGNVVGGAGFVALAYLGASPSAALKALAPAPAE